MKSSRTVARQGRLFSPAAFAAGLLLFFMPFVQFKCKMDKETKKLTELFDSGQRMPVIQMTGIDMLRGRLSKPDGGKPQTETEAGPAEGKVQWVNKVSYAIFAFSLALTGLALSFFHFKNRAIVVMVIGLMAATSLLLLLFQFRGDYLQRQLKTEYFDFDRAIDVRFTIWFYLSVASFLLAAFFSYRQGLEELE